MSDVPSGSGRWLVVYLLAMIAILAVSCVFTIANAQTARTATITFTRPTKYVDGTDIAAGTSVTYRLYQGARGAQKVQVTEFTGTATQVNYGLQPGETCWQVSAIANGKESELSNEGCKTFAWPATEPVTITVT